MGKLFAIHISRCQTACKNMNLSISTVYIADVKKHMYIVYIMLRDGMFVCSLIVSKLNKLREFQATHQINLAAPTSHISQVVDAYFFTDKHM